ncbi:MAG: hypothetical protein ACK5A3_14730, partial [Planctomyces sp.]
PTIAWCGLADLQVVSDLVLRGLAGHLRVLCVWGTNRSTTTHLPPACGSDPLLSHGFFLNFSSFLGVVA